MSFNRLTYDRCAYNKYLSESTSTFDYQIYGGKYKNCGACQYQQSDVATTGKVKTPCGEVGYSTYPLYSGKYIQRDIGRTKYQIIDIESELRGQYRLNSLCPNLKYLPDKYPRCERKREYMPPELCPVIKTNLTEFKNVNFENSRYPLPTFVPQSQICR